MINRHALRRSSFLGWALFLMTGLLVVAGFDSVGLSEDGDKVDPYEQFLQQLAGLLETREYASALELVTDAESDPELKKFREKLKVDHQDMVGLVRLASIVKEQASKLKSGDTIKIGSTEYKVDRFVSDAQGDRLILTSAASSTKTEKSLAQLDARTWLSLAQRGLTTSAEDRYLVGMYLASVEHGDRKAARDALNLAAADKKIAVTHWTTRLDAEAKAAEEARKNKKAELDDPILGTWRLVIGNGKKERKVNITFRAKGRTDLRASTWRKTGEGKYVLTFPTGGTARFIIVQNSEKIKGDMANGEPIRGARQAKEKP